MNLHQSSQTTDLSARNQLLDSILQQVHDALEPHVQAVEAHSPGHNFGKRVLGHMIALTNQAPELAASEGLSLQEAQLLGLGLGIHDIGRVLCEAEKPGDRAYQHQHGAVGAKFLRENELLRDLKEEERNVLLAIVEQHSSKDVTLTPGTLEYRLCYIARDLDKIELINNVEGYLSAAGALKQLSMWMLSDNAKSALAALSESELADLHQFIAPILKGESLPQSIDCNTELKGEILLHLVRPIPQEYLDKVARGETLTKEEMISGYPAYMLAHIALANDVVSSAVKTKIHKENLLGSRINYIILTDPNSASAVSDVLSRLMPQ